MGDIALQYWGEAKLTHTAPVTVLIPSSEGDAALEKIVSVFPPRIPDALKFARQYRSCPIKTQDGWDIDISLGISGYEKEVMQRTVDYDIGEGRIVKVCSAEDFIINKAIAGRPQDIADMETVVIRQGKALNMNYIDSWLKDFSFLLEMDETMERLKRLQILK